MANPPEDLIAEFGRICAALRNHLDTDPEFSTTEKTRHPCRNNSCWTSWLGRLFGPSPRHRSRNAPALLYFIQQYFYSLADKSLWRNQTSGLRSGPIHGSLCKSRWPISVKSPPVERLCRSYPEWDVGSLWPLSSQCSLGGRPCNGSRD